MFFLTNCYFTNTVNDGNIKNWALHQNSAKQYFFLVRSCHWTSSALQSCDIAGSGFGLSGVAKVDLTCHLSLARPPLLLGLVVLSAPASLMACHFLPFSIILSLPPSLSSNSPSLLPHTHPSYRPSLPSPPPHSLSVAAPVAEASDCSCGTEAAVTYLHSSGTNRMVGCSLKVISPPGAAGVHVGVDTLTCAHMSLHWSPLFKRQASAKRCCMLGKSKWSEL